MPDIRTPMTTSITAPRALARALAHEAGVLAPRFAQVGAAPKRTRVKSLEATSTGGGKPPRVGARTWGNCGAVSAGTTAPPGARAPAPPEVHTL